ncbi:MAG: NUDIX hydrolase [Microbacterium sp.]|jgi:ADP-ribose pyrophosphatase|nr:NUDIX hydrolase [Microbacterium sp.]
MTHIVSPVEASGAGTEVLRDEPVALGDGIERRTSFHGYVWDVVTETFAYGDETLTRDFVHHPGAAAVVALDDADRMILIQQYRHPIRSRDWEIPAGLLDVPGEDTQAAAARELAEEADLQADRWQLLGSIHTTPGGNDEIIHIYLARGLSSVTTDFVREGEEADMRREWVALNDVIDGVLAGRFQNGILAFGALAAAEVLRRGA